MQMRGRKRDRTRNHRGIAWTGKVSEKFMEKAFREAESDNRYDALNQDFVRPAGNFFRDELETVDGVEKHDGPLFLRGPSCFQQTEPG
jgi:hypothetical protein